MGDAAIRGLVGSIGDASLWARGADGGSVWRDRLRQALNLILALGQSATTWYVVATGADAITSADPRVTTVMVPAGYAFSIWGPIYASTAAYGVYQARPSVREDPRQRRVG